MVVPDIPFKSWPKIPRLYRDIVISEKIDGTSAGILCKPFDNDPEVVEFIYASSRKRWITPKRDNFGFAKWVEENAATLVADLGPGMHFGEWWGSGIQRRYGLDEKRFSLFNTRKWGPDETEDGVMHPHLFTTPGVGCVPILYQGPYSEGAITGAMDWLKTHGSAAAPGFVKPEGIVVYFIAAGQPFKYTLDGDGAKGDG